MNLTKVSNKTIEMAFYLLFFLVPIIWLPVNSELFEFNKIILVYLLTIIIAGFWVLKSLSEKKFEIRRTPLDIPIALFLLTNILSTIFSLDQHTSIFGYYGRWHGGLLSTLAYIVIYYALLTHFEKKQIIYYLATLFLSGLIISIYAVLQHPNPLFKETTGDKTVFHGIDYDYWAVDVENRVFATLGQPNWLAAFLALLILPIFSLLFILKKFWQQLLILASLTVYYLAFTFTYSRGGLVGLLFGAATFVLLFPIFKSTLIDSIKAKIPIFDLNQTLEKLRNYLIPIILVMLLVFFINQYFGNALARRGGLQTITAANQEEKLTKPPTQLELSGNQTAKIRTIVWTGALNIFRHYPLFGSGVETFGYSYYLFRPVEHNLTAEWDYLYNKAHNEYLNYLATTGALGFLSYIILIASFELLAVKLIIKSSFGSQRLLSLGLLAGFNSNLAQNFFGFSVVPTGLLFFLFPAIFLSLNQRFKPLFSIDFRKTLRVFQKNLYTNIATVFILLVTFSGIYSTFSIWLADYFYNKSLSSETYQKSISDLKKAIDLNKTEPLYKVELAKNLSALAETTFTDGTKNPTVAELINQARKLINEVVKDHASNTSFWIEKRTIDYNLSKIDAEQNQELLQTAEKLKDLAPTDASIQYDVALVYLYLEKEKEGLEQLGKVVNLKKDYREPLLLFTRTAIKLNESEKALKILQDWIKSNPNDSEAKELLKTLLTA